MGDTTITKIDSKHSPKGAAGQKYLAIGKSMSMRLWENEKADQEKSETKHEYETVGFVIKGKAELHIEGQMVLLNPGDSWVVPIGASHRYKILEEFSAVETTSPPAELHDRASADEAPGAKEFFEATAHDADAVKAPEPVKGDSPEMKAKANTESQADASGDPERGKQVSPDNKSENKSMSDKETKPAEDDKKSPDNKDNGGQVCDPVTKECKPGAEDGASGQKEEKGECADDKEKCEEKGGECKDDAQAVQEVAAQIPRTESEPTSNAEKKEAKPAEHIDVGQKCEEKKAS